MKCRLDYNAPVIQLEFVKFYFDTEDGWLVLESGLNDVFTAFSKLGIATDNLNISIKPIVLECANEDGNITDEDYIQISFNNLIPGDDKMASDIRKVECLQSDSSWKEIEMKDLINGDIFRMFNPDGIRVSGVGDVEGDVWMVTGRPYVSEDNEDIWAVPCVTCKNLSGCDYG